MSHSVYIRVLNPRERPKYRWPVRKLTEEDGLSVFYGAWERPLEFVSQGTTAPVTTQSIEFYWRERPYAIAATYDENWALQELYGRVIRPPRWSEAEQTLDLIALGLDVQVTPGLSYDILEHGDYDALDGADLATAQQGLMSLIEMIERQEGPFDPSWLARYEQLIPSDD